MKRCILAHHAPGFGHVPVGSLWSSESEYLTDANADCFEDVCSTCGDTRAVAQDVQDEPFAKFDPCPDCLAIIEADFPDADTEDDD